MDARSVLVAATVLAAASVGVGVSPALAKGKGKVPAAETGVFSLDNPPSYIRMAVPKDYDKSKWYPLFYFLHNTNESGEKPDPWVQAWSEDLLAKGWIVAGPASPKYDNEESIEPLKQALAKVQEVYHIDERRIVIAGNGAGANMAWRMATRVPELWAGILVLNGEVTPADQSNLKKLAGKPAYVFAGARDTYYSPAMVERDKKFIEYAKIVLTVEVKPEWERDFPRTSIPKMVEWLDKVWPAGAYREKAEAVEAALKAKDIAAIQAALAALAADLKKNPYPAFEGKVAGYNQALLDVGRAMIADANKLVGVDPLKALEAVEAAVKCLKGLKPLDAESVAARAVIQKDPAVVEAVKKKQAETLAVQYMEKGAALEAKGELAKALEMFRKVVALGETSKKEAAEASIKELEPRVPAGDK